jgi:hypothetical protein
LKDKENLINFFRDKKWREILWEQKKK